MSRAGVIMSYLDTLHEMVALGGGNTMNEKLYKSGNFLPNTKNTQAKVSLDCSPSVVCFRLKRKRLLRGIKARDLVLKEVP